MSLQGSEDEELSLLEGLEPPERAGLVDDEGARVVALLFRFAPAGLAGLADVCFPAVDVVASSGRNLLMRRMPGPGRVFGAAAAGFFMSAKGIGGYLTKSPLSRFEMLRKHE